ncbi:MAG TPA: hypothetical protein VF746_24130 [Longimicrobium sp.]
MSTDVQLETLRPPTTTVVLDAAAREAVRAIAETSVASLFARGAREVTDDMLVALWASEDALAATVVHYALRTGEAPAEDELRRSTREHRDRLGALGSRAATLLSTAAPALGGEPFLAGGVLRTTGFESCRHVELVAAGRGLAFEVREVPAQVACAQLEERVLTRAVWEADDDGPLSLELDAAHWYFDRWRAPVAGAEEDRRRHYLRAQEWALVDRTAVMLGSPVVAHLVARRAHASWPARQRQVLEMLAGSFPGLFELREADGAGNGRAVSVLDGRALDLLYDPEVGLEVGDLIIGRLLPFGDGRWFPSLGTEARHLTDPALVERMARACEELRRELPDALAVEGAVTRHLYGVTVPRNVPPAQDPDDAVERLHALRALLAARGADEAAERLTDQERGRLREVAAEPGVGDPVLAAWALALMDLARKRIPARRPEQRRRKRRAKRGKRR